jgi:hypothetical protein
VDEALQTASTYEAHADAGLAGDVDADSRWVNALAHPA